jgi:uncharacterized coiled-coil protein SlyX
MSRSLTSCGIVIVSDERLAVLETEVSHVKNSIGAINDTLKEVQKTNASIEKTLVELAGITKSNTTLRERMEKEFREFDCRLTALERLTYRWGGAALIIIALLSVITPEIKAALLH